MLTALLKTRLYAVTFLVLMVGCATGGQGVGRRGSKTPGILLGIRTTSGDWLEIAELRGKPTLLFVFATFDSGSQAAVRALGRIVARHPDVQVVGVAAQPDPATLVDAWAYALNPNFTVGYDPTGSVEEGQSALGKIEAVPMFILLDEGGRELRRVDGYKTVKQLDAFLSGDPLPDATP